MSEPMVGGASVDQATGPGGLGEGVLLLSLASSQRLHGIHELFVLPLLFRRR